MYPKKTFTTKLQKFWMCHVITLVLLSGKFIWYADKDVKGGFLRKTE